MRKIKLGKLNKYAIVDDEDYERLSKYKWHASKGHTKYYAVSSSVIKGVGKQVVVLMHRLVMDLTDKCLLVDHINNKTLDNRKSNLRIVTPSQNTIRCKRIPGKKYKGIFKSRVGNWVAKTTVNKKGIHIGTFKTKKEAAIAYNKAALMYHGHYAHLNKI